MRAGRLHRLLTTGPQKMKPPPLKKSVPVLLYFHGSFTGFPTVHAAHRFYDLSGSVPINSLYTGETKLDRNCKRKYSILLHAVDIFEVIIISYIHVIFSRFVLECRLKTGIHRFPGRDIKHLPQINRSAPIFYRERVMYDEDKEPNEYCECFYRGDRSQFQLRMDREDVEMPCSSFLIQFYLFMISTLINSRRKNPITSLIPL